MPKKNFKENSTKNKLSSLKYEAPTYIKKCNFNFCYFTKDKNAGQDFTEWHADGSIDASLINLFRQIKEYTNHPLTYWLNQRVGSKSQNKLEHYSEFPKNTKFTLPSHTPKDVKWARFRLNNKVRLIGFTADTSDLDELDKAKVENTFFVVFLDKDHEFYITGC